MMPTFPLPPLKFRTVGFPQYGFKAGISGGPSHSAQVHRAGRFASVLRARRLPRWTPPYCAGERCALEHRRASGLGHSTPGALAPLRVILSRTIITYPAPSAPLASTSRFRRLAAYTRCLRCAYSPRRPVSGSVLSLSVPSRHAALYDRGEPIGCLCPVPSPTALAFAETRPARHSQVPPSSASDGTLFSRLLWFAIAAACRVARPPGGSDRL
jgi:hypothetical protein